MPNVGYIPTEETRNKISQAMRGRVLTEEHRKNISEAHIGMRHLEESKRKMSVAKIGNKNALGRKHSNKTKQKMALAKEKYHSSVGWSNMTSLQKKLGRLLCEWGIITAPEVSFGRYIVDLYDGDTHTAYEADGDHWHNHPDVIDRDKKRDEYLKKRYDLNVIRYTEDEINVLYGKMDLIAS